MRRRSSFAASPAQQEKCHGAFCLVCDRTPCDPAHVIDRSLITRGQDDALAVVALCRTHHDLYDRHELDILPELERWGRDELAYAVLRFGLISTLKRVSATDWKPA